MKFISTVLFAMFSIAVVAQDAATITAQPDDRLYEVYDKAYLERLEELNPFVIQRWNFYLDNGFYIMDIPTDKPITPVGEVVIEDLNKLNILQVEKEQQLTKSMTLPTFYKIKGQEKFLVYYAGKDFVKKLNKHLGRSYK